MEHLSTRGVVGKQKEVGEACRAGGRLIGRAREVPPEPLLTSANVKLLTR